MTDDQRKWRSRPTDEDWWESTGIPVLSEDAITLPADRYTVSVWSLPQEVREVTSIRQLEELSDWLKEHQQDEIHVRVYAKVSDNLPLNYIIEWTGNYRTLNKQRRGHPQPVLDFDALVPSLDELSDEIMDIATTNAINLGTENAYQPIPYVSKPVDPSRAEIVTEADWWDSINKRLSGDE